MKKKTYKITRHVIYEMEVKAEHSELAVEHSKTLPRDAWKKVEEYTEVEPDEYVDGPY